MDMNIGAEKVKKQQLAILQEDEEGMSVPNWLVDVLKWISRIEMATSSLSFSCKLFNQLCWPKLHGNVKPRQINEMQFCENFGYNSGKLLLNSHKQSLKILNVLPSYIVGFNYILIFFLDDQLLELFQNILLQLNQIDYLAVSGFRRRKRDGKKNRVYGRLLDLLANKNANWEFHTISKNVIEFNQLFPGVIQKVHFLCTSTDPSPAEFDLLFDWLALPLPINADTKQKILKFIWQINMNEANKFLERVKKKFSNDNVPLNFFIVFQVYNFRLAHFNMENKKTGEIMALTEQMHIVRCPKSEENYWIEEGMRKIGLQTLRVIITP